MSQQAKQRNPLRERRAEIIRVFAELGLVDLLERAGLWRYAPASVKAREAAHRASGEADQPARLRRALEELGGAFVKLGQMLSVRRDLVPAEYVAELEKLQDSVAPTAFDVVRQVIERELERPLEDAYAVFSESPLGSASISQVHAARLHDGTEVVVKVQRPGVRTLVDLDLELMARAARTLANSPWAGGADLVGFVSEFSEAVRSELDLTAEARNLDLFSAFFGQGGPVVTPVAYWEHTTGRVLTESRIDGISLNRPEEIRSSGGDAARLIRNGVDAYVRMVFELRRFHSDPHPGNLVALEGDAIGFLDFGRVSTLSERALDRTAEYLFALAHDDASGVTEAVLGITHAGPDADFNRLKADIETMMDRYSHADIADTMGPSIMSETLDITRRHDLHMPSEYAMLFQTFGILQGVVAKLDPHAKILDLMEPYIERLILQGLPERAGKEVLKQLGGYGRFVAKLPEALDGVLRHLAQGELGVRFKVDKGDEIMDRTESMVDRVSLTILLAAMAIALALASGQSVLPEWGRVAAHILLLLVTAAAAWLFLSVASAEHRRRRRQRASGDR